MYIVFPHWRFRLRATLESTPLKVSSENIQMIKDSISPLTSFNSALFARKDKHSSRSVTARSSRGHMRDEIRKHMNRAATRIQVKGIQLIRPYINIYQPSLS